MIMNRFRRGAGGSLRTTVLLLFLLLAFRAAAQEGEISVAGIPATVDELILLRDSLAVTPEGGAAVFLLAMIAMEEHPREGMEMFTLALDRSLLAQGSVYKGFAPGVSVMYHINRFNRDGKWSYIPRAYIWGTVPEDGYAYGLPLVYRFSRNPYSGTEAEGTVKVFVSTYGVSPRPVTMKVNDKGLWKAAEVSSLFVDVVRPPETVSDDL